MNIDEKEEVRLGRHLYERTDNYIVHEITIDLNSDGLLTKSGAPLSTYDRRTRSWARGQVPSRDTPSNSCIH